MSRSDDYFEMKQLYEQTNGPVSELSQQQADEVRQAIHEAVTDEGRSK